MAQANATSSSWTGRRRFFLVVILLLALLLLCIIFTARCISPEPSPPAVDLTPTADTGLIAEAGGPYTVAENQALSLEGQNSTGTNITHFHWDFGNGLTGDGPMVIQIYPDGPAEFTVTLTLTDEQGRTSIDTAQVIVENLPPMFVFGNPYQCQAGETITLGRPCSDPSPVDAISLQCIWSNASDGLLRNEDDTFTCPDKNTTVTVDLEARDKDGATTSEQVSILVAFQDGGNGGGGTSPSKVNPTAKIITYLRSKNGLIFGFDARQSSDVDGKIITYEWDFGDGNTSAEPIAHHAYAQLGTYTVTLTVTDDSGSQGTASVTIP